MNILRKFLFLQITFLFFSFVGFAQLTKPNHFLSDRLQVVVNDIVADTNKYSQGIVMTIRKGTEWEWTGASGTSNESMEKADTAMVFRAASITKMFTAITTLKMVEKGLISLDDTITDYLPLKISSLIPYAGKITIQDLLYHRSGLEDFQVVNGGKWLEDFLNDPTKKYSLEYLIDLVKTESLEPPAEENYSNTNYLLLGLILDSVYTAGNYHDLVKKEIIDPLGLKKTFFETAISIKVPSMGSDYYLEPLSWYASADIITSTRDLIIVHNALLKKRILNNYLTEKMITPHPMSRMGTGMGYSKLGAYHTEMDSDFVPERWGIDGVFPVSISNTYYLPAIDTYISFNAYPDIYSSSDVIASIYKIIKRFEADGEGEGTSLPDDFKIYPNPFNEKITVESGEAGIFQILDGIGIIRYSKVLTGSEKFIVPTTSFSKGLYIAKFISSKTRKVYTLSIIKE